MNDRERAVALADEIQYGEPSGLIDHAMNIFTQDERQLIVAPVHL